MGTALLVFTFSLCVCPAQAAALDGDEVDSSLTRYSGVNKPQVDLLKLSRQNPLGESLVATANLRKSRWVHPTPANQPSFAENKLDVQDLLQHFPLASQTLQIVTNTAVAHPQVARWMRFLTKHVDPQF
jgi:hypothetical protein